MPRINYNLIFKVGVGFIFCLLFLFPINVQAQSITAEEIFELVNNERVRLNLQPLTTNETLQQIAVERANDMAQKKYFSHQSPEGSMPWDIAMQKNYDYQLLGENLATDWQSAVKTVQAWMTSSTHKDNILNPEFQETGIAVANQENNYLIVQIFGKEQATALKTINSQVKANNNTVIVETETQDLTVQYIIPNSPVSENQNILGTIHEKNPIITGQSNTFNYNYLLLFLTISYFPLVIYLHLRLNTIKSPF